MESCGKTTLAYTAPLPIAGFQFDLGLERAIHGTRYALYDGVKIEVVPYDKTKVEPEPFTSDITVFECPRPLQLDTQQVQGAKELWAYFLIRIGKALQDPNIRSIVVDTMTLARRIKADAHLQQLQEDDRAKGHTVTRKQLIQIEYGTVNDAIRDIWNAAPALRKNLIGVHHLTDEYGRMMNSKGEYESVLTGNKVLEGLNNTKNFVDVALRMDKGGGGIVATWLKCGYNLAYEGTQINDPTWDTLVDTIEMGSGGRLRLEHRLRDD